MLISVYLYAERLKSRRTFAREEGWEEVGTAGNRQTHIFISVPDMKGPWKEPLALITGFVLNTALFASLVLFPNTT